jgi:redox-sensitive bicupin YhaK (pirin superfamily)
MEAFQLWVNLPAKDKMIAPRYQDIRKDQIPEVLIRSKGEDGKEGEEQLRVRVIAGCCADKKAVIDTRTPILYLDMRFLQPQAEFTQPVPENYNGFVYIYRGSGLFGSKDTKGEKGQVLQFGPGDAFRIKCTKAPLQLLLIAGVPLNEPVARMGPFVMNTEKQIRQAFADYHSGRMGAIGGAEERYRVTREAASKSK